MHGTFTDTDGSGVASVKYAVKKAGASAYAADQTIASDGEYTAKLKKGGFTAFGFDIRCFFGSIISVFKSDGVVEGGTGELKKRGY